MTESVPTRDSSRCLKDHHYRVTEFSNVQRLLGRYLATVCFSHLLRRPGIHITVTHYLADSPYVSAVAMDGTPSSR